MSSFLRTLIIRPLAQLDQHRSLVLLAAFLLFAGGVAAAAATGVASMMAFSTLLVAVVTWYFGFWGGVAALCAVHVLSVFVLASFASPTETSSTPPLLWLMPIVVTGLLVIGLVVEQRRTAEWLVSLQKGLEDSLLRLQMGMQLARAFSFDWNPETDEAQRSGSFAEIFGPGLGWQSGRGEDFFRCIAPEDQIRIRELVKQLTPENPGYRITFCVNRLDGQVVWLEETARAEFDAAGKFIRLFGTAIDVTHRKRMEDESRAKSELLAKTNSALEQAQTIGRFGNWSFDLITGKGVWSKQLYDLYDRDAALGPPPFEELIKDYAEEDAQKVRICVGRAIADGRPYEVVLKRDKALNGVRHIRSRGQGVLDANGKCIGLIGACMDVTADIEREEALRVARAEAEAANRAKSDFLANMSHEIRTPMTAILGYADILLEDAGNALTAAQRQDFVATIKRNGDHLLAIINDILDISKIEAQKMSVERVAVSPAELLAEVQELMRIKAFAKELSLECQCLTQVPKVVYTDPTRLRQILVNLVGNALKFTEVGEVRVRLWFEPTPTPTLIFEVSDTGIGMNASQVERVFQAFEQGDSTTTRRFGGSGLGLPISKRLAEILGGEISVTSVPGLGSTFRFCMNISEHDDSSWIEPHAVQAIAPKQAPSPHMAGQRLQGVRLVLAEDGPDNQRLVSFHLRRAGAEVDIVENGRELLELLSQDGSIDGPLVSPLPYDLIITDVQMPELDGYSATERLRARGCTLPILALTAHTMSGESERSLAAGCSEHLSKPLDCEALVSACAKWTADSEPRHIHYRPHDLAKSPSGSAEKIGFRKK